MNKNGETDWNGIIGKLLPTDNKISFSNKAEIPNNIITGKRMMKSRISPKNGIKEKNIEKNIPKVIDVANNPDIVLITPFVLLKYPFLIHIFLKSSCQYLNQNLSIFSRSLLNLWLFEILFKDKFFKDIYLIGSGQAFFFWKEILKVKT